MELREQLKHGDVPILAEMAGVARGTVKKTVYEGRRNPKVMKAALMLLQSREAIKRELNS